MSYLANNQPPGVDPAGVAPTATLAVDGAAVRRGLALEAGLWRCHSAGCHHWHLPRSFGTGGRLREMVGEGGLNKAQFGCASNPGGAWLAVKKWPVGEDERRHFQFQLNFLLDLFFAENRGLNRTSEVAKSTFAASVFQVRGPFSWTQRVSMDPCWLLGEEMRTFLEACEATSWSSFYGKHLHQFV